MRRPRRGWQALSGAALLAGTVIAGSACTRATTPPVEVFAEPAFGSASLASLAVLPAEGAPGAPPEAAAAAPAVTEMTVREVARHDRWRVLEAETGGDPGAALAARTGEAAERSGTDAGLGVLVLRWRERVGSDYGVAEPASVALRLILVPHGESRPVWTADYAFTQEPLAYNLWNLWGVLRGGPRWLTARELARIGVSEAIDRLARATR